METLNQKNSAISRIKTYIDGLDQNLEGGIPENHVTLVCGSAGTMKSSICFNIAYNEALRGKTALYISLEQSAASLISQMQNMGFDFNKVNLVLISDLANLGKEIEKIKLSKRGNIVLSDIGAIRKEIKDIRLSSNAGWLNVMKNIIKRIKVESKCDIFVLDSLSALYVLSRFDNPRIELFYMFEFLRDAKMTSFLISEMPVDQSKYSEYEVEDYLSDGIVYIKLSRFRRDVVREISIVKMRATACNHDIFSLEFKNSKFQALYGGQTPLL